MQIDKMIFQIIDNLIKYGESVNNVKWQSVKSPIPTVELNNIFLKSNYRVDPVELGILTKADLPWAEEHFQERISGIASNPGKQWKNWPHYNEKHDDATFRSGGIFSHTYMERFWPDTNLKGMRYNYGNLSDVISRLRMDTETRQAYLSIWHPEDQSNNEVRVPCSLGYYFLIRNQKLHLTYFSRSVDVYRHFRNDVYMAIRLAQHVISILNKSGYDLHPGFFNMWIGSLHYFINDKKAILLQL